MGVGWGGAEGQPAVSPQWNFVMNPLSNAQDPDGAYTRKWVPELAGLPAKHIHCPWQAPPQVLRDAQVRRMPCALTTNSSNTAELRGLAQ